MTTTFNWRKLRLPAELNTLLDGAKSVHWPRSTAELLDNVCGQTAKHYFEVAYSLPDGKEVVEAAVARVRNGVVVNYPEPYMRRREPDCMFIADDLPTDKPKFEDRFGYKFEKLRGETFEWLKDQDLTAFAFVAGQAPLGVDAVVVAPANAGFFTLGLALLQGMTLPHQLPAAFSPKAIIYVAPPFRHTHFAGKQVVVHDRGDNGIHDMFAYNLYPGPSAKKGVYGALIHQGEAEGWIVTHCSVVQVITPYDNVISIMHEGASGGGKSEMLEQIHREPDGRLLLGSNTVTGERIYIEIPRACELRPVTDDMAMCHSSLQKADGRVHVADAENGWFLRVNHIHEYGTDPFLEKLTAQPTAPLMFMNIDAVPDSRALIWEHIEDAPGKPCPNPRVIMPRQLVPGVVSSPVGVDIRSFGVRTPPCTKEKPSYGIIGLCHLLPPALGWLWRLVAPRGYANPSIVDTEGGMSSEGVGSYWPFATGRRIPQANLLLDQVQRSPSVRYVLCPNQYIGAWKTGFMPQWIAREYLARRGHARFQPDQLQPSRCTLLGYSPTQLQVEGRMIHSGFLQVNTQPEVGNEAYDIGAEMLWKFFHENLEQYLSSDLSLLGRQIIECCLNRGILTDFERLLPGK